MTWQSGKIQNDTIINLVQITATLQNLGAVCPFAMTTTA